MKAKCLGILLCIVIFIGCDDSTGEMGLDMLPGSDLLEVMSKTYPIETSSILSGPVFAKTTRGYIGKYTDPKFGAYEAGFMTQLNCVENFQFPEPYDSTTGEGDMAGDTVVSIFLQFTYDEYFGDSLSAARMSVYKLNKRLEPTYTTDVNPELFYHPDSLLGRKAYTAVDQSLSDSIRRADGYRNYLVFSLPKEYGNHLLRLNWNRPEFFKDANAFIDNVFPGIYAKSEYGDGTILYIDQVDLNVIYNVHLKDEDGKILKKKDGTDSIETHRRAFVSTKEVIQANRFENSDKLAEVAADPTATYIKSPAGIFTQATLPIQKIQDELSGDTINSVKLTFTGYVQHDKDDPYSMSPPNNVVLLRQKDQYTFFETNSLTNESAGTSYLASYINNEYSFTNITNLIRHCIAEKEAVRRGEGKDWTAEQWAQWEEETKWNSIVLVPVVVNRVSNTATIQSIHNDLRPGYVKLKNKDDEDTPLEIKVEYTEFY